MPQNKWQELQNMLDGEMVLHFPKTLPEEDRRGALLAVFIMITGIIIINFYTPKIKLCQPSKAILQNLWLEVDQFLTAGSCHPNHASAPRTRLTVRSL